MTKLKLISINEMIYSQYPSTGTNPIDYLNVIDASTQSQCHWQKMLRLTLIRCMPENTNNNIHRLRLQNRNRHKKKHTLCGLMPAAATYTSSFPMGIPIP